MFFEVFWEFIEIVATTYIALKPHLEIFYLVQIVSDRYYVLQIQLLWVLLQLFHQIIGQLVLQSNLLLRPWFTIFFDMSDNQKSKLFQHLVILVVVLG